MDDKQRVITAAGGAVGLGTFTTLLATCCGAPWAAILLGAGGAVALARLSFLFPYALLGTFVLLALAFWVAYRKPAAVLTDACSIVDRRRLRWIAWGAVLAVSIVVLAGIIPVIMAFSA